MSWAFEWSKDAARQYRKLDHEAQRQIDDWVSKHLDGCDDPTSFGHRLKGSLVMLWRYRIGDYRLLCHIEDGRLLVLGLEIEKRDTVYKQRRHNGRGNKYGR